MKYFLYSLFVFFSSRGILLYLGILPSNIDLLLNLLLKGSFIVWFFFYVSSRKNKSFISEHYLMPFLFFFLLSSLINITSIEKIFRFFFNVFTPIFVFYFIQTLTKKEVNNFFKFIVTYIIIQILFSFVYNIESFLSGNILVDDFFFGFFGFPRAYYFTYLCLLISFWFGILAIKTKKKMDIFLFILFYSVQFFSGAGTIILFSIPILILGALVSFEIKITNIILIGLVLIMTVYGIMFYKSQVLIFEDGVNAITEQSIDKNPKFVVFFNTVKPLFEENLIFIFGKGPGNYLSYTAIGFNIDLSKKYNSEDTFGTNAYGPINNIIGFWGDIGIFGLITYYLFIINVVIKIIKMRYGKQKIYFNILLLVISFSLLYSTVLPVFDDAYFSYSFWIIFSIVLKLYFLSATYKCNFEGTDNG